MVLGLNPSGLPHSEEAMSNHFDESLVRRAGDGRFTTKPPAAESEGVDMPTPGDGHATDIDAAYEAHRDPGAAFAEHGPGGWGSWSSEVTLAHDARVAGEDGHETVLPAGTRARLRTDFENLEEGDGDDEPLRLRVALEVPGEGEFEPADTSWATMVDATDSRAGRSDALEKIHTAMRYAAQHEDEAAFRSVAETMSWQGSNPRVRVDFRIPERVR